MITLEKALAPVPQPAKLYIARIVMVPLLVICYALDFAEDALDLVREYWSEIGELWNLPRTW